MIFYMQSMWKKEIYILYEISELNIVQNWSSVNNYIQIVPMGILNLITFTWIINKRNILFCTVKEQ